MLRHKKNFILDNSKKLYLHSKENNEKLLGILLITKLILTELLFLKEKNESAAEYDYSFDLFRNNEEMLVKHYKHKYTFEFMDAFTPNINMWRSFFTKKKLLKKKLKYLEIGSFEGRSSVFVLENLQNSDCFFVDPFEVYEELTESTGQTNLNKIYENFLQNIDKFQNRTTVFKGTSDSFFNQNENKFDLIYVDGSHFGEDVYRDAVNSFNVLNDKGYIIFDDFFWFFFETVDDNPLGGIFKFLVEQKKYIKTIYVSNQLIIQKKL